MSISRGTGSSALKERPEVLIERHSYTNFADFHIEARITRGIVGTIDFKRIGNHGIYAHRNGNIIDVEGPLSILGKSICSIRGVEMASIDFHAIRVNKDKSMSWNEIEDKIVQAIASCLNVSVDELRVVSDSKSTH